ncbi:aspartate/glutamate racemase family protein [Cedecea neteri]|uniref:aspartate/glutamate racemase family protein n=1 Tax=Cedecea neteri TaxID=158822 RepID=UPI002892F26A|nr:aspartate/glutamate racemase family protein [Cedecea neteri]WNJ78026.1 aspartate/glutamate racemase family protein [Cedecea neteri]
MTKKVVLLHATSVAMSPVQQAFNELWPEAEISHLLDDGLTLERAKSVELTTALIGRFVALGQYAWSTRPDAILITCSAFGPAISALAKVLPVPVIKPNEAMFQQALKQGKEIGMLATFSPALATMTEEFEQWSRQQESNARLRVELIPHAIDALRKGDMEQHNQLVAAGAERLIDCDVIMLAHFSTSLALSAVQSKVSIPVLTAPHSAVNLLRSLTEITGEI